MKSVRIDLTTEAYEVAVELAEKAGSTVPTTVGRAANRILELIGNLGTPYNQSQDMWNNAPNDIDPSSERNIVKTFGPDAGDDWNRGRASAESDDWEPLFRIENPHYPELMINARDGRTRQPTANELATYGGS